MALSIYRHQVVGMLVYHHLGVLINHWGDVTELTVKIKKTNRQWWPLKGESHRSSSHQRPFLRSHHLMEMTMSTCSIHSHASLSMIKSTWNSWRSRCGGTSSQYFSWVHTHYYWLWWEVLKPHHIWCWTAKVEWTMTRSGRRATASVRFTSRCISRWSSWVRHSITSSTFPYRSDWTALWRLRKRLTWRPKINWKF